MVEMACVSFNKVRLHYYVNQGNRRAIWLNYLLQHPFRLFGTTLIGVNVAMVVGSECSREFHSALGLSPDLAPLSQVIIVVIFAELAPMFAARHYAEHVAMLGAPLLYASAKLLTPVLWLVGLITRFVNLLITGREAPLNFFLSQEELQTILKEHAEERPPGTESDDFNVIAANIFRLRYKDASQVYTPLTRVPKIPSSATIGQLRNLMRKTLVNYIPIYHKVTHNIVGIAFPRDLVRVPDTKRVRDYTRAPWFVTQTTKVNTILHQFRRNNQSVAIILDEEGKAVGLIDLDDVLEQLFGKIPYFPTEKKALLFIERSFPGEMKVADFNTQFNVILSTEGELTLSELMTKTLGHTPEKGESVYIKPFELTAKETSLLEAKTISIKTLMS